MNYYFDYEQERFNNVMYSYNNYYDDSEGDEEEEEKEKEDNKIDEKKNDNSLFDENEEEEDKKTEKRNVYFSIDNNINEKELSSEEDNDNNSENEYNNLIIKDYKLELNKKYKIYKFPRPKTKDLIYINQNNLNYYLSKPGNYELIPSVISSFVNIENMNSSLKLIRPTQHVIPYNLKGFEKTINLFGFNIEPFSIDNYDLNKHKDKDNNKEYIPLLKMKINFENVKLAECVKCKGVYHQLSSYCKKVRNESLYQIYSYKCSICRYKSSILVIDPESKNNYDIFKKQNLYYIPKISDISGVCPSIEYLIEKKNLNLIKRYTLQIIIIEINNIINNEGSIEYIYQSLYQIIKENNSNDKDYDDHFKYSLIVYDRQKIYFIHLNNKNTLLNNNLEITIMNDFKNPFCPLPINKLFYNKKDFLFLLEKFQNWLLSYKNQNNNYIYNSINININTILTSISNLFNNNYNLYYHHLIIFSFSYPNLDLNYLKNIPNLKFYISLFLSLNKSDNNIPFINNNLIHNIKIYLYKINYTDYSDIKQKYEKIYFDLYSILSNDSYKDYLYDISYNISYDKSFFYNKLNKNNDTISIKFLPNSKNLNILSILPQYGYPDLIQSFLFQFKVEYYSVLDNYQHIRILSWYSYVTDKTKDVYDSYDQDTLFRISLYNLIYDYFLKENKNMNNNNDLNIINKIFIEIKGNISHFLEVEKIIKEQIINSIIKYRREVNLGKDFFMILIPHKIRNIILYYYSFFKQIISGENLDLFNSLFHDTIKSFIKNIYPNILCLKYLSDTKKEDYYLIPSSIDNLYRDQLLLIDNDKYIKLLINDKVKEDIINHYLINYDKNELNDIEFTPDCSYLKKVVLNKPIKIQYINENNINNIFNNFVEDPINLRKINNNESIENLSYFDYFIQINKKVSDYFCN